jgi:hypothetical protein
MYNSSGAQNIITITKPVSHLTIYFISSLLWWMVSGRKCHKTYWEMRDNGSHTEILLVNSHKIHISAQESYEKLAPGKFCSKKIILKQQQIILTASLASVICCLLCHFIFIVTMAIIHYITSNFCKWLKFVISLEIWCTGMWTLFQSNFKFLQ